MKTEEMIRELRRLEDKHKNDFTGTCENNWSAMCHDVADRLEEQEREIAELNYTIEALKKGADMQEVELKPCPFCGGKAVVKATTKRIGFTIWCECNKCYARTDGYVLNIEKEDTSLASIEECKNKAIERWNRRV